MSSRPIGVFDSGVGGLAILREVRHRLPNENLLYFADQIHVPYGPRPLVEVRHYAMGISRFLQQQGAKVIVVACNTASAAALGHLRESFPETPFVGMEPAVKPAAEVTESGHVGVLATPATFQGELFASVVARFASGVQVHQNTAPGLVDRIEAGDLTSPETRELLAEALQPLLSEDIDTLVLGCTHYPFVIPVLEQLAGPDIRVIDPAPAVARQTLRVLQDHQLIGPEVGLGRTTYWTTGDPGELAEMVRLLIGQAGEPHGARWQDGSLRASVP